MKSLRKKGKYELYDDEMKKLVEEGYAESIPIDHVPKAAQFLPHHAVTKNNGDLRMFFDCASKFQGMSLNGRCLQGTYLNNHFLDVLLRFRQYEYVFMGDVMSMYYQVKIPEKDRDALCFLWYDAFGDVVEMRTTCHVFGGVWCASSSTYALRKTADLPSCPEVIDDLIYRAFYVDDCLFSSKSIFEANHVLKSTSSVLSESVFRLTKFVSNRAEVLDGVLEENRLMPVSDVSFTECKALGIKWSVATDQLYF